MQRLGCLLVRIFLEVADTYIDEVSVHPGGERGVTSAARSVRSNLAS